MMNRKHVLIAASICLACICKAQVNKPLSNHQNTSSINHGAVTQTETPIESGILAITFSTPIDSSLLARTIATPIGLKDLEKMNELWINENKQLPAKTEDKNTPKKK